MDPNSGHFHPIDKPGGMKQEDVPGDWPVFTVGQQFTINGVVMRVRKVTRRDVIMRPVMRALIIKDQEQL